MKKTAVEVLQAIEQQKVKWIALQFVDLVGGLQNITIPAQSLKIDHFSKGIGKLDGSSIKGFKEIHESDMLLFPDPQTFAVLPWYSDEHKTARFFVNVHEGFTAERFSRDSRYIAEKACAAAAQLGYDTTYWGPELEFFVFDGVKITPSPLAARDGWQGNGYEIQSKEAVWNQNTTTNTPIRFKEGYYPAPPQDTLVDFRNEVCRILQQNFGITVDAHHHEVATAGQCEINMKYDQLITMADNVVSYKNAIKMLAHKMGMISTFMPKPIFGDNASGMHVHQSLWKQGKNTFFDPNDKYAELSQTGRYYIGGLLTHARTLCAFTNPTTNSYRRLVPGYEAPVYIAYSKRNRSANVRIPMYEQGEEHAKRIEYRTPDPSCNPYLAFSAMLAAGLDGVKRKIDPGDPVDEDIYKLNALRRKELGVRELPGSLREALDELETDNSFLKGIFDDELLGRYIEIKRDEQLQVNLRPTPYEFYKYLDS